MRSRGRGRRFMPDSRLGDVWERVVDLVATGGYALKTYDPFRRIVKFPDGVWARAQSDDVSASSIA